MQRKLAPYAAVTRDVREKFPYSVEIELTPNTPFRSLLVNDQQLEIMDWLDEMDYSVDECVHTRIGKQFFIYFSNPSHAIMCKLVWAGT